MTSMFRCLVAIAFCGLLAVACSGSQGGGAQTADDVTPDGEGSGGGEGADTTGGDEGLGTESMGDVEDVVCAGYNNDEVDPVQRWVHAFPIERGGAVLVFVGPTAEQMDVEATLEMAAIMGYEDQTCGTAVVVWVPGIECGGQETELARRVEEGTTMLHGETVCFRIDEVGQRFREECERGTLPAHRCP